MKKILLIAGAFVACFGYAQDVQETFNGTRILNGHSVETLKKKILQFRIEHRFGDIAGDQGGAQQFFGFDQAADIRFALEYGVTDKLMVGLGRSKGTGVPYRSLLDAFAKYRVLTQNDQRKIPVSVAVLGSGTMTYQKASEDISILQSYPEFAHRLAYCAQLNVARKFGERISIAVMPTYVHRNFVNADDVNGLFALGGAANVKITKGFGVIFEGYYAFHEDGVRPDNYNSVSGGVEWVTNGHNFKVVVTNSRGFNETQFIPYTFSNWLDNQYRLGFSITRNFKL